MMFIPPFGSAPATIMLCLPPSCFDRRGATARWLSRCLPMVMMKVVIRFVLLSVAYLVFAGQMSADGSLMNWGHDPLK